MMPDTPGMVVIVATVGMVVMAATVGVAVMIVTVATVGMTAMVGMVATVAKVGTTTAGTGGTVEAQRMRGGVSQALQCLLPIGIAE